MEVLAAIAALAPLALALLEAWAKRQPARERRVREANLEADLERTDRAIGRGDAEGISQAFERERLEGLRLLPGGRAADGRLQRDARDPGQPAP